MSEQCDVFDINLRPQASPYFATGAAIFVFIFVFDFPFLFRSFSFSLAVDYLSNYRVMIVCFHSEFNSIPVHVFFQLHTIYLCDVSAAYPPILGHIVHAKSNTASSMTRPSLVTAGIGNAAQLLRGRGYN